MKSDNKNFYYFLSFAVLIIAAVLILVDNLFPLIGLNIGGLFFTILRAIKDVFILIVISVFAYRYVVNLADGWKIVYWVAIGIFIVAIVLSFLI